MNDAAAETSAAGVLKNRPPDFGDDAIDHGDFRWAEHVVQSGELAGLVSSYKNIPPVFRTGVDRLLTEAYSQHLFLKPLYEAARLLFARGHKARESLPFSERLRMPPDVAVDVEFERARAYVTSRNPEDIVVLVLRSGKVISTMTLFPLSRACDIPSLAYLELDPAWGMLPDVPALEVGRLAKIPCEQPIENARRDLLNSASTAVAFKTAREFAVKNGFLNHSRSFICGDTHNAFIETLKRFFPLETLRAHVNPEIFDEGSPARDVAIYFFQRQILGSFRDGRDLLDEIHRIGKEDPDAAAHILRYLVSGLKDVGVNALERFNPGRFRVKFFYFPFNHISTQQGFRRLEQIIDRFVIKRSKTGLRLKRIQSRIRP